MGELMSDIEVIYEALKDFVDSTEKDWNYITPVELEKKDKKNLFLLDIRKPEDFKEGHIKGATNIFWLELLEPENLKKLPTDKTIVLICYVGHTSSQALVLLRLLGFDVIALKFGMGKSPVEGVPVAGWLDYGFETTREGKIASRVFVREFIAHRPIKIDSVTIRELVGEFFKFIEWAAKSSYPQQQFGNVRGIVIKEVEIESVIGSKIPVIVRIDSKPDSSSSLVNAGGAGTITKGGIKYAAIFINVNGKYNAEAFLDNRSEVEDKLGDRIYHELTHIADVRKGEPSGGRVFDHIPDSLEVDIPTYLNHPAEVRAYMREVVNQVRRIVLDNMKGYSVSEAVSVALSSSKTWEWIKEYLSDKNKKIILDAVYRSVSEIYGDSRKVAGLVEPPPAMVEAISNWAEAMYSLHMTDVLSKYAEHLKEMMKMYQDGINNPVDKSLMDDPSQAMTPEYFKDNLDKAQKEYDRARTDADNYLLRAKSYPGLKMQRWKRAIKKFRVDATGWRYKSVLDRAKPESLALADKFFGMVNVELTTGDLQGKSKAYWMGSKSLIRISVGENIRDEVEHELTHWAQSYLDIALKIPDFGRPPRDIRTPQIKQAPKGDLKKILTKQGINPDEFHSLDDIEFYTDLAGEIRWFKSLCHKFDINAIYGSKKEMLKVFVGISEPPSGLDKVMSRFFITLKKHAPGKWKKAVNELAKEVL